MKMKKWFCAALMLLFVISIGSSALADTVEFTWGMTEEDVISLMGNTDQKSTQPSGNTLLRYYDQHISDFDCITVFLFTNDSLIARVYGFTDDQFDKTYEYLGEALDIKYGSAVNNPDIVADMFSMMGFDLDRSEMETSVAMGGFAYKTWAVSSDMNIALSKIDIGDVKLSLLAYMQPEDKRPGDTGTAFFVP